VTHNVVQMLRNVLGDAISTDETDLEKVRADKSGHASDTLPLCVVYARSTEDVQAAMRIANQTHTPVVTRGGGSGLAGGAIGASGEIVLSVEKMNSIVSISVADRQAVVQAGVINAELNAEAMKHGLWFAPDPASRPWSTIGGNIATNAGGLHCVKYGVTRDAVRSLTVVLANGEVIDIGHNTVKGVTGLDLLGLFVGSEGTLGVITQATVALNPLPEGETWTVSGWSTDLDAVTNAVSTCIAEGRQPALLELIDHRAAAHIARFLGRDGLPSGANHLIAQTDGSGAREEAEEISTLFRESGLIVEVEDSGDDLIAFRRAMHPAMEQAGNVLIEDVAVPRSQLPAMFSAIREIEREFDVEIPTVAHAGDGNLHPNFIYEGDSVPEHVWLAADRLFTAAVDLGGTLTGEHGVGLLKRHWLRRELGDTQWELQWGIKKLFDPHGILNPGKVFEPSTTL